MRKLFLSIVGILFISIGSSAAFSSNSFMLDWNICSLSERSVVFHFYGRCEIVTVNNESDQVIAASFGYVGGVFANVTDGGYSGTANEVVVKCDQFLTQDQKGVVWNFDYNLGWYSPSLQGRGSEAGGVALFQLFPNL